MTRSALGGVMAALVTPLDENRRLDRDGLDRLLAHILAQPVAGICPAGSTGEGPLLDRATRAELTRRVAEATGPRVPVITATAGVSADSTLADIDAYAAAGATAALVAPPSYYPLSPTGVAAFYERVADAAALPILFYNIPVFTKVALPVPVVADLAAHDRVLGIKDSSRDMEYFSSVLSATASQDNFAVFTGSDTLLLPSVAMGAAGTICGSANLVPDLVTGLFAAAQEGRLDDARRLQRRLHAIISASRKVGSPAGWKAALELAGICSARTAAPGQEADPEAIHQLGNELVALEALAEPTPAS